ncbi:hypothetical protein B4U79_17958 [Dinothrombium tinctorium]|uniref:Lysozyme n=1 Tax=Dinothrombium tinctorium TaxID=1965070 RepID=A0A443REM5_9ACAR|nr:hypothetical protein B4U79_17958 [Dinothrombium tinctorium]
MCLLVNFLSLCTLLFASKYIDCQYLEGIDVSKWQGNINWPQVAKSGIKFAFVKATEGVTYTDPKMRENFLRATSANLYVKSLIKKVGVYHFARPDRNAAAREANAFYTKTKHLVTKTTLLSALDIESNPKGKQCYNLNKKQMSSWIKTFIETYKNLTGSNLIIYTNTNFWNTCVGKSLSNVCQKNGNRHTCPLWLARYNRQAGQIPKAAQMWSTWTFWQYTDKGRVNGIRGSVDRNKFKGSEADLKTWLKSAIAKK